MAKRKKSTNLVNETGNDVNEVRIKNKKKDDDDAGGDSMMDEFGVDMSKIESTQLPTVAGVSPLLKKHEDAADALLKLCSSNSDQKNLKNKLLTLPVRTAVSFVLNPTPVHNYLNKSICTDVDSTEDLSKDVKNSILEVNPPVQSDVQNVNEIDQIKNNFEFDLDDDSELSFFSSTESVGEECQEAL